MATNLLKRLESSVNSFRLTITRIKDYIESTIRTINNTKKIGGSEMMVAESVESYDLTVRIANLIPLWDATKY